MNEFKHYQIQWMNLKIFKDLSLWQDFSLDQLSGALQHHELPEMLHM